MAKPELGTKRLCGSCGAKFYDLSKDSDPLPEMRHGVRNRGAGGARAAGLTLPPAPLPPPARCGGRCCGGRRSRAPAKEAEVEVPETADVELVSLEDADAEAQGKKTEAPRPPRARTISRVEETEEAPFIEENEEGDEDVTDIIGEGREDEEET